MRPSFNKDNSGVNTDFGTIPWDTANNRPLDWQCEAGRVWKKLKEQYNITEPLPYVAPPPTADKTRRDAFKDDVDRQTLVDQVKNATPDQIKTYITNNVTDLASARAMLTKIVLLVAMTLRD